MVDVHVPDWDFGMVVTRLSQKVDMGSLFFLSESPGLMKSRHAVVTSMIARSRYLV